MKRRIHLSFVLKWFIYGIYFYIFFISLGCSKSPEVTTTSQKYVASPPTISYQTFLDQGIDKCLNGQHQEAIPLLLKAREMNSMDGKIHFWLYQAYRNTETDTSKKSKAYIEAQNVIALMPGTAQSLQAQEFVEKIDSSTHSQHHTPPTLLTETKKSSNSAHQQNIISSPVQKNIVPEVTRTTLPTISSKNEYTVRDKDLERYRKNYEQKLSDERTKEFLNNIIEYQKQEDAAKAERESARNSIEARWKAHESGMRAAFPNSFPPTIVIKDER